MADVNDVHGMERQADRNREKVKTADIDARDRDAILEFGDHREFGENVSAGTLRDDYGNLRRMAERAEKPLVEFENIKDANRLLKINSKEYSVSDASNDNYRGAMRVFFKWLNADPDSGEYEFWDAIEIPNRDPDPVDPDELLSPAEIRDLRDAADHPREEALIEFLADTGMRAAAALQVKRGDIYRLDTKRPTFKPNKDGEVQKGMPVKPLPIIHSRQPLRTYLNQYHPDDHPDAPVFAVKDYGHRDRTDGAMHPTTASQRLKDLAETAGIDRDRVHPHAFRHVATTRMRRDMDMEWDDIAHRTGWSRRSLDRMKDIYSHLTNEEKNDRIFQAAGRDRSEDSDSADATPLFEECSNCGREISAETRYCPGCGASTDPDRTELDSNIVIVGASDTNIDPDTLSEEELQMLLYGSREDRLNLFSGMLPDKFAFGDGVEEVADQLRK